MHWAMGPQSKFAYFWYPLPLQHLLSRAQFSSSRGKLAQEWEYRHWNENICTRMRIIQRLYRLRRWNIPVRWKFKKQQQQQKNLNLNRLRFFFRHRHRFRRLFFSLPKNKKTLSLCARYQTWTRTTHAEKIKTKNCYLFPWTCQIQ